MSIFATYYCWKQNFLSTLGKKKGIALINRTHGRKNWGKISLYWWNNNNFKKKTMSLYLDLAFELWCWRRLLRVSRTARKSNQSILNISTGCSLEGLMLKVKLQYFGHLIWLIRKDPDAERDWGQEEKWTTEDEMVGWHHRLDGHESE